jgi:hypothetical protein
MIQPRPNKISHRSLTLAADGRAKRGHGEMGATMTQWHIESLIVSLPPTEMS